MKKMARKLLLALLAAMLMVSGGCIWVDEDDDDDEGYFDTYCCYEEPPPVVIEEWYVCGADWTTLEVGEECACGGCFNACCDCCTWVDYDYSVDTLELSWLDEAIVDLQFNYTLTNWGNYTTTVWVTMCDAIGCEGVIGIDILPGEVIGGRVPNPVLDTLLDEYYDCLWFWGDLCYFDYDVEVYLDQECTCSPVTLDYFYEGLYVY